ncbi:MAG: DUF3048 domain-containing protein [Clostridia bacterium]|nr:DUF3048 domain-containing protein [Clostridia bacterium]
MQRLTRTLCLLLAIVMIGGVFTACNIPTGGLFRDPSTDTTESSDDSKIPATESDDTSDESDIPGVTSEPDTSVSDTAPDETDSLETPGFVNPLTGLPSEKDFTGLRPAAIMVNNIAVSCPQKGVGEADIIYECLVEGGYTRLMMLSMDYANLGTVGSVRSTRHYYLDFSADYDAIHVHAGASTYAYDTMDVRVVHNLDGVNMYLPATFFRDPERIKSMGLEHSLMTTGDGIVSGVKYKKYRTTTDDNFDYPVDFVSPDTTVVFDEAASHVRIPYSAVQTTDFVYDEETETYLRYQFNGKSHIDQTTGEQLAFDNVLIYFCETGRITGDAKLRIEVGTVGNGTGFYATKGTYVPITWEKDESESPIRFYDADGELLLMNPGKTFISVCPTYLETSIQFNYEG